MSATELTVVWKEYKLFDIKANLSQNGYYNSMISNINDSTIY